MRPIILLAGFIILLVLEGCSTAPDVLTTDKIYRKDVVFWVGNQKITGMGTTPKAASYEIYINYPYGDIDFLMLTTCHRQIPIKDDGHKFSYTLVPTEIELRDGCPMDIGIFNEKGRHGWAYLFFEKDRAKLQADVQCNGEKFHANGVSACEAAIGSIQRISFAVPVRGIVDVNPITMESIPGCELESVDGVEGSYHIAYEYKVNRDFCYFGFYDHDKNIHEHTPFGYEEFIVR